MLQMWVALRVSLIICCHSCHSNIAIGGIESGNESVEENGATSMLTAYADIQGDAARGVLHTRGPK